MPIQEPIAKPISLVGMPGSGKTTIGKPLAKKLGLPFYDLDTAIKKQHGTSPADILRQQGEPAFREIELATAEKMITTSCVLATGGGAFVQPATRRILQENTTVVWLNAPLELLQQRLAKKPGDRPLSASAAALTTLYKERQPSYALAEHHVEISRQDSVKEIVQKCLNQL